MDRYGHYFLVKGLDGKELQHQQIIDTLNDCMEKAVANAGLLKEAYDCIALFDTVQTAQNKAHPPLCNMDGVRTLLDPQIKFWNLIDKIRKEREK